MYLIIIGADALGTNLARLAAKDGHNVVVIESDQELARDISEQLDVSVLHADIAAHGILDEAGVERADAIIATTRDDATNLMAMFLATEAEVRVRISVVNDAGHEGMFHRLDAHVLLDPEIVVARHLYGMANHPKVEEMALLDEDETVFGIILSETSILAGRSIAEIKDDAKLPEGFSIVAIKRDDQRRLATGEETLEAGDHLTVYSIRPVRSPQLEIFVGKEEA